MNAGLTAKVAELARRDPEAARELIVATGLPQFAIGLLQALKNREVWAYRLFARIAKMVGADTEVKVAIFQQLGVPLHEAKGAVGVVRRIAAMTDEEREQDAIEWLTARGYTVSRRGA